MNDKYRPLIDRLINGIQKMREDQRALEDRYRRFSDLWNGDGGPIERAVESSQIIGRKLQRLEHLPKLGEDVELEDEIARLKAYVSNRNTSAFAPVGGLIKNVLREICLPLVCPGKSLERVREAEYLEHRFPSKDFGSNDFGAEPLSLKGFGEFLEKVYPDMLKDGNSERYLRDQSTRIPLLECEDFTGTCAELPVAPAETLEILIGEMTYLPPTESQVMRVWSAILALFSALLIFWVGGILFAILSDEDNGGVFSNPVPIAIGSSILMMISVGSVYARCTGRVNEYTLAGAKTVVKVGESLLVFTGLVCGASFSAQSTPSSSIGWTLLILLPALYFAVLCEWYVNMGAARIDTLSR